MATFPTPQPIFDTIEQLDEFEPNFPISNRFARIDYNAALDFLKQYTGNKATYEAYRREIERMIQWAWLIHTKSILKLSREDVQDYLKFCMKPPKSWIGKSNQRRFVNIEGAREPNPKWRPFVINVTKNEFKKGVKADKNDYKPSQKSIQEIFTVLNSFYNYLLIEEKIKANPIALIRQKSKYLQKQQSKKRVMRLSEKQWECCIETIEKLAEENPTKYQRSLFLLKCMYLMYLRISELAASERWTPTMGNFFQDTEGNWWFKTLGKGNKLRDIAVSDDMKKALRQWRKYLGLSPLPYPNEQAPLIPKERSLCPIESTRLIRMIIQDCFDQTSKNLWKKGLRTEATNLEQATAHWLRHTGISDDINKRHRPIAHVRDDAGHSSSAITDRYNDIELLERHKSAKKKKIISD